MSELIMETGKTVKSAPARASQPEEDNDREMNECLARLKVWQVENLMSPNGMDRFTNQDARGPKKL